MGSRSDLRGGWSDGLEEVGGDLLLRPAASSEALQLHRSGEFLAELVADFLAAGVVAGDGLLVFATETHGEIFRRALTLKGHAVDRACASGRLVLRDARETLDELMVDGMPDPVRFEAIIARALAGRAHGAGRGRVRVYSEMADLLRHDGNERAAARLEELWTELGRRRSIWLLCAHGIGGRTLGASAGDEGEALSHIGRVRAQLFPPDPGEPVAAAPRHHADMTARRARRLAAEIEHRKEIEVALRGSLAELRRAEEALRESQEELQDFVDNAAEGMEWLDPEGVILWANRAQLDLLGYEKDEYVGHNVSEFRADREVAGDFLARLGQGETLRDYETVVRCRDGSLKHVLVGANVFRKDGEFVHTRCFTRDITARKRAHDALVRLQMITAGLSEARTQSEVLDVVTHHTIAATGALGACVYLVGADGNSLELARAVSYADRAMDRTSAIPLGAALPMADAFARAAPIFLEDEEACERYPEFRDTVAASGSRSLARLPLLVDGRPIGVLGVSHGERHAFGENERAFLIALTHQCAQALERARLYDAESRARRQAEAGQRRSAFLSRASAILSSSLDYEATLANLARLAASQIADVCMVELAGEAGAPSQLVAVEGDPALIDRWTEYRRRFPPDPAAEVGVARVIATGLAELHREIADGLLASFAPDPEYDGFLRAAKLRSAIIVPLIARGRTLGAIALLAAGSDRRFEQSDLDMAEELGHRAAIAIDNGRLYREAREADRRKDEFLAMLGHELRNPLAPILTGLKLMQLRGVGGDHERQIIERQVKYLVRLVDDLLDVSRITRGRVELDRQPIELASVLGKAIEMASPLFEQRAHLLTVEVPREGLVVDVDQVRLAQVLANLLTNAAKYTDPHGRVTVTATREPEHVTISVRDSGIGIQPDVLPVVFDMFVQGDRALDRSQGGLGIGLTLARSLVEAHGGTISAHSGGSGQGSEFRVRLPAWAGRPATERESESIAMPAVHESSLRILLVDDNVDAADVLAEVLRGAGHQVLVAYDGPQALGVARSFEPDAALLDIGLPVLDGYELAGRLRELLPGRPLKLIAVTGYGQDSDKTRTRAAGFDVHLVKPIDLGSLFAALEPGADGPC